MSKLDSGGQSPALGKGRGRLGEDSGLNRSKTGAVGTKVDLGTVQEDLGAQALEPRPREGGRGWARHEGKWAQAVIWATRDCWVPWGWASVPPCPSFLSRATTGQLQEC